MSITLLCSATGVNSGTPDCPVTPGFGKYFATWSGKLTATQLMQGYAICKAALIANSKLSKATSGKLTLFPAASDLQLKKQSNTEATLPDGSSQVTREGVPVYEFTVKLNMHNSPILRRINNKDIKYVIIDDANLMLGTLNEDGEFTGRQGKVFVEGIDVRGFDKQNGQTVMTVTAANAYETFDNGAAIQLDSNPERIFKSLKDIQIYPVADATLTGATAPTRTVTLTAVGNDGDTINILDAAGVSLTGGPVTKTSSETTVTLLAVLIKNAINAATATNGGFTANNAAGVLTITGTAVMGAFLNTVDTAPTIVGAMTATHTAFTGGVNGSYVFHLSGKITPSPLASVVLDFYSDYGASALGTDATLWKPTNGSTGAAIPAVTVAPNAAGYFDVTPTTATIAALPRGSVVNFNFALPPVLDAALVLGIEGVIYSWVKP